MGGSSTVIHNASTYTNHRCRCAVCTASWRVHMAQQRENRKARLREDPSLAVHGSPSTYTNWGCRCDECRKAHAAYIRRYRADNA